MAINLKDIYSKILGTSRAVQSAVNPYLKNLGNQIQAVPQLFNPKNNVGGYLAQTLQPKPFVQNLDDIMVKSGLLYPQDMRGKNMTLQNLSQYQMKNPSLEMKVAQSPVARTLNKYAINQVISPISEGVKTLANPKETLLNKGLGVLGAAGGVYSATPQGMLFNTAFGTAAGTLQTITKGGSLGKNVMENITSFPVLSKALGIEDKTIRVGDTDVPVAPFVDIVGMLVFAKAYNSAEKAAVLNKALKSFKNGNAAAIADSMKELLSKYPKEFKNLKVYEEGLKNLKPNEFRLWEKGIGLNPQEKLNAVMNKNIAFTNKKLSESLPKKDLGTTKEYLSTKPTKPLTKGVEDFDKFLRGDTDSITKMTQQEVDDLFNTAELKASDNVEMKMFKEKFNSWVGARNAAETKGIKAGLPLRNLSDEDGVRLIRFSEGQLDVKDLPDSLKDSARYLRSAFDEAYNMARKEGIDINYAQNYVTHIWDKSQKEVKVAYQNYLNQGFKFANGRTIPTYDEGIAMGLKPKYTQPAQIISEYVTNVERLKSNINFFKDLRSQGLVVPAGVGAGKPGFEPIVASGFPSSRVQINENIIAGNYYAPTPVANLLNRMFSTAKDTALGKVFGATGAASQKIQNLTLSGGIGPVNAFSFAQGLKEVMALRLKSPIMSTIRSFSDRASREFFVEHIETLAKMQESGINLVTNLDTKTMIGKNPVKGLGGLWNRIVEEPTFKRLLPMLQVNFFEDIEKSALRGGLNPEEAINIASKATKNFYGLTEAGTKMARDKLGQDVIRTFTFAPTYRESMINVWVNAIKGLKHPLALENRATTAFLGSAVLMYYGMDRANRAFNGGRPMSQNPKGTEDKLLIPYKGGTVGIPYLSSIATVPKALYRFFSSAVKGDIVGGLNELASSNLSMLMKPLAEIAKNENYFGAPIYDESGTPLKKNTDIAYHLFKSWVIAHPYITALMDRVSGKTKGEPLEITLSKALEMPFRYYKKGAIDSKFYSQERDKALSGLSTDERNIYDGIMSSKKLGEDGLPVDTKRGEMGSALLRLAYPNILKAETQTAVLTAAKTGQPVNPFYTLDPEQQQVALILKTLYPGSKEKAELTAKNIEWLKPYWTAQTAYFSELKAKGIIDEEDVNTNTMAQETLASPEIAALEQEYYAIPYGTGERTAFIKAHPELAAWWSEKTSIVNEQRAALGLAPISSGFSSSYKKKPYFKKISAPKLKKVKLTSVKFKKPKFRKTKTIKLKKPKLSNIRVLKTKKIKFA